MRLHAGTGAGTSEQVYYTHCLPSDSYSHDPGYSIRATSIDDPELLRFVSENSSYELPLDLWGTRLTPPRAPRRLARVRAPDGRIALIHTAYLSKDTCGRDDSFFSHVMLLPELTPRQALEAWSSPDWRVDYTSGADKRLPSLNGPPRSGGLNDHSVTAFLKGATGADQNLATLTCPARLATDPLKRREILQQVLLGCLRAFEAEEGTSRSRFYLLAEPGLTALLLYAAVRLLPEPVGSQLTFSTFENMHQALKSYRLGRVVGTYTGNASQKGLDADFYTVRGYALDTFSGRHSPELGQTLPEGLTRLMKLAADGEWGKVDRAYAILGAGGASAEGFLAGLEMLDASENLALRRATEADLLTLRRQPAGRAVLTQYQAYVWELVREQSLARERLRQEFADLLRENLPELKRAAEQQLANGNLENWQRHWTRLRELAKDPAAVRESFVERVRNAGVGRSHPELRLELLQQWHSLPGVPEELPIDLEALLAVGTPEALQGVLRSGLPVSWRARALYLARFKTREPEVAKEAQRQLRACDDSLLRTFWDRHIQVQKLEDQARVLELLLGPKSHRDDEALARVLAARCAIHPLLLHQTFQGLGAYDAPYWTFWQTDQRLRTLLLRLGALGEASAPVWNGFLERIDQRLLTDRGHFSRQMLRFLDEVVQSPSTNPPAQVRQAIEDWGELWREVERPEGTSEVSFVQLREACKRRGIGWERLLEAIFVRDVLPYRLEDAIGDRFAMLFHRFHTQEEEFHAQVTRVLSWTEITGACKDPARHLAYQRYYLEHFVPWQLRGDIVEQFRNRLHPELPEVLEEPPAPSRRLSPPLPVPAAVAATNDFPLPESRAVLGEADVVRPPAPFGTPEEPLAEDEGMGWWSMKGLACTFGVATVFCVIGLVLGLLMGGKSTPPPRSPTPVREPETSAPPSAPPATWDGPSAEKLIEALALEQRVAKEVADARISLEGLSVTKSKSHLDRLQPLENEFAQQARGKAREIASKPDLPGPERAKLLAPITSKCLELSYKVRKEELRGLLAETNELFEKVRGDSEAEPSRAMKVWKEQVADLSDTIASEAKKQEAIDSQMQRLREQLLQSRRSLSHLRGVQQQVESGMGPWRAGESILKAGGAGKAQAIVQFRNLPQRKELVGIQEALDELIPRLMKETNPGKLAGEVEALEPRIQRARANMDGGLVELAKLISPGGATTGTQAPSDADSLLAFYRFCVLNDVKIAESLRTQLLELCGLGMDRESKSNLYSLINGTIQQTLLDRNISMKKKEIAGRLGATLLVFVQNQKARHESSSVPVERAQAETRNELGKLLNDQRPVFVGLVENEQDPMKLNPGRKKDLNRTFDTFLENLKKGR